MISHPFHHINFQNNHLLLNYKKTMKYLIKVNKNPLIITNNKEVLINCSKHQQNYKQLKLKDKT